MNARSIIDALVAADQKGGLGYEAHDAIRNAIAFMQAREDAQPVAWRFRDYPNNGWVFTGLGGRHDGCEVEPLYIHPAPDALRETFEDIKSAADSFRDCEGDEVAHQVIIRCDQALAALQAEQKGGA